MNNAPLPELQGESRYQISPAQTDWQPPHHPPDRFEKTENFIHIEIADETISKRYTSKIVKNVTVKESPEWLQKRLNSIGIRSINNIVDVTNFVLMEMGHPIHAFDLSKIEGKKIIVRRAEDGEKVVTLDEKERKHFFEKQGAGSLNYVEDEGLVFERMSPGKVTFALDRNMPLPSEVKGRVYDLRLKTVSEKVEPFLSYARFYDILGREIETQEIECFASPQGFWDFFGVKIPRNAVSFQWKIAVANSCQSFTLKEMRLISE